MINLRSTFVVLAVALAAPIAAYAQAGGVPSSTAPSNSEGTPSSSTGVVGTTRVGPSATAGAPMGRHRAHHRARHHHRRTAPTAQ